MKETKFKDTELGKIPEEWEVCNLGSIGVPLMCKRIMKWQTNKTAGVPFYKIGTFGKQADAFIAPDIWRYMITHFNYPKKATFLYLRLVLLVERLCLMGNRPISKTQILFGLITMRKRC